VLRSEVSDMLPRSGEIAPARVAEALAVARSRPVFRRAPGDGYRA
jgi:hypothetical protein